MVVVSVEAGKAMYRALGLPEGSQWDSIKRRYRELALRHHPDKNIGDPDAGIRFAEITAAYDQLSNASIKEDIDALLAQHQATMQQIHLAASLRQSATAASVHQWAAKRRAHSAQTRATAAAGSSSTHTPSATSSSSTTPPSQYTAEQTAYFRQREKQREKELAKRQEQERQEQQALELERYRKMQEERFRDEEKRVREARARLEKAEATLYHQATTAAAAGGGVLSSSSSSMRRNSRRDSSLGRSSNSNLDASTGTAHGAPSSSTFPSSPTSEPPNTARTTADSSYSHHSTRSTAAAAAGGGDNSPLSNSNSATIDAMMSNHNSNSSKRDRFERMRRERERQDEIRRNEQEKFFERRLQEVRARETKRAQEALDEERRMYERELLLLQTNEESERCQYWVLEEELERRRCWALFQKEETAWRRQQRHDRIERDEAMLRCRLEKAAVAEREALQLCCQQETNLRECQAAERFAWRQLMALDAQQRYECQLRQRAWSIFLQAEAQARWKLQQECGGAVSRLHLEACSVLQRQQLEDDEVTQRQRLATRREEGLNRQRMFDDWHDHKLTAIRQEERCAWMFLTTVWHQEVLARVSLLQNEVRQACFLQREKGAALHRLMLRREKLHEATIAELLSNHDRDMSGLTEEVTRLHAALAAATEALLLERQQQFASRAGNGDALVGPQPHTQRRSHNAVADHPQHNGDPHLCEEGPLAASAALSSSSSLLSEDPSSSSPPSSSSLRPPRVSSATSATQQQQMEYQHPRDPHSPNFSPLLGSHSPPPQHVNYPAAAAPQGNSHVALHPTSSAGTTMTRPSPSALEEQSSILLRTTAPSSSSSSVRGSLSKPQQQQPHSAAATAIPNSNAYSSPQWTTALPLHTATKSTASPQSYYPASPLTSTATMPSSNHRSSSSSSSAPPPPSTTSTSYYSSAKPLYFGPRSTIGKEGPHSSSTAAATMQQQPQQEQLQEPPSARFNFGRGEGRSRGLLSGGGSSTINGGGGGGGGVFGSAAGAVASQPPMLSKRRED